MSDLFDNEFSPESLMLGHGYAPQWSEGSIKQPIYQTSTFVFKTAEEGKAHFQQAYQNRSRSQNEPIPGLIYSRLNNPNIELFETRLALWDKAAACASFDSGMAAISAVMMEFVKPGEFILFSSPSYGGTDHFIKNYLHRYQIYHIEYFPWETKTEIIQKIRDHQAEQKISLIFVETPANPNNALFDIEMMVQLGREFSSENKKIKVAVDNTYMGPLWQQPLQWGADFSIYSATKYIGGHSDVIAGAVCGGKEDIQRLKNFRSFFGSTCSPFNAWLLNRSLETMKIRMEKQAQNAASVAEYLNSHPSIEKVHYLGLIPSSDHRNYSIFQKQYTSAGAMISFEIKGGEAAAFQFLNHLQLCHLAVSLGSTETLAEHPATMTHAGVSPEMKEKIGITSGLIRLSVGIENAQDLIQDIEQALSAISSHS